MASFWDFQQPGGLWGAPEQPPLNGGYGGGVADQMTAINSALQQNAALPPPQPGFAGKGGTLWDIIGAIGDGFGGKGIYTDAMQQNRQIEADQAKYEQRRQQEMADWQAKQEYERANKDNTPDWEQTAKWLEGQGRTQEAADIRAKATMVSTIQNNPATGESRFVYAHPSQLSGGADIPVVSSAADAAKLPPGSSFRPYPGGPVKKVPGGAGPAGGSGGFQF